MRKTLLILLFAVFLLMPGACALNMTQSTILDGQTLTDAPDSLSFTVTGMNTALYDYKMVYALGELIASYPKVLDGTYDYANSGDADYVNVTSSAFTILLHPEYYPFDECIQELTWTLYELYKTNGTGHSYITNTTTFNITGTDNPSIVTYASVKACDPFNFDFNANRIVDRGFYYSITGLNRLYTYVQIPYTIFLTDNESNLIAWGNGNYFYDHNDTFTWSPMGAPFDIAFGIKWKNIVWGKSLFTANYTKGYYIFVGIPLSGGRTCSNTLFSNPDNTMSLTNFSLNGYSTADKVYRDDLSKTYDYVGGCIYFETAPTKSSFGAPVFTIGMLGTIIRQYSVDIGLPWFYLVLAVIVLALFMMIPWKLAIEYDLKIPNFIYGILLIAGMFTNMMLYLIDFWMFGLFVAVIALTVIVKYREDIEKIVTTVSAYRQAEAVGRLSIPRAERIKMPISPIGQDKGVRPYIEQRKQIPRAGKPIAGFYQPVETKAQRLRRIINEIEGKPKSAFKITDKNVLNEAKKELSRLEGKNDLGILASNGHKVRKRRKR